MKLSELEAIYKANISTGHIEALEALYLHGYASGAGLSPTAVNPAQVKLDPAPSTIIKLSKPDLR